MFDVYVLWRGLSLHKADIAVDIAANITRQYNRAHHASLHGYTWKSDNESALMKDIGFNVVRLGFMWSGSVATPLLCVLA